MRAFITVAALLVIGCSSVPEENGPPSQVQELRSSYCKHVLTRETCKVLVRRNEYKSFSSCSMAFEADNFCTPPIASTIREMNDCALRIGRDWSTPEECFRLRHE